MDIQLFIEANHSPSEKRLNGTGYIKLDEKVYIYLIKEHLINSSVIFTTTALIEFSVELSNYRAWKDKTVQLSADPQSVLMQLRDHCLQMWQEFIEKEHNIVLKKIEIDGLANELLETIVGSETLQAKIDETLIKIEKNKISHILPYIETHKNVNKL